MDRYPCPAPPIHPPVFTISKLQYVTTSLPATTGESTPVLPPNPISLSLLYLRFYSFDRRLWVYIYALQFSLALTHCEFAVQTLTTVAGKDSKARACISYAQLHARIKSKRWPATRTTARQAAQATQRSARARRVCRLRRASELAWLTASRLPPGAGHAHAHHAGSPKRTGRRIQPASERRVISAGSMHALMPMPAHPCMQAQCNARAPPPPGPRRHDTHMCTRGAAAASAGASAS